MVSAGPRQRLGICRLRQGQECAEGDGRLAEVGPRGGRHRRGVPGRQADREGIGRVPSARRQGRRDSVCTVVEKRSGRSLAAELNRRFFAPLGMRDTYLPTKPWGGIKGPHGHGYAMDETGTLHDADKINATIMLGAGGVVSTARDVSTFNRALRQGRLLPESLSELLTGPPPGMPPRTDGGPCAGNPEFAPGSLGTAPGFVASTASSSDGRLQFAVSVTLSGDDAERMNTPPHITDALKSVFCPSA
ncbi:serine hydrolase [Streptomyces sp. NPDC020845]|uniref:serine hydrolase n=1 Tax=Streptomyces sp. NPDC020845 TaxID=3365096 RepID=UPI003796EF23